MTECAEVLVEEDEPFVDLIDDPELMDEIILYYPKEDPISD